MRTILSTTYAENASKWNLAWALYAGLAYKVTPGLSLELTYRYVNLGTATTGLTNSFDGVTVVNATPFQFGTITSQDVMLGFRWNLGEPELPVDGAAAHSQGLIEPDRVVLQMRRGRNPAPPFCVPGMALMQEVEILCEPW